MTAPTRTPWTSRESDRIRQQAEQVAPGGVQSSIRGFEPVLAFTQADGARIRDADGNEYLDYHLAFGATLLGHRHPAVLARVAATLDELDLVGTGVTPPELEICELVVRHVPSAERVLLANSGAEATYHAIRLARAVTGRTKIVKFQGSYHGWHDGVALNTGPGAAAADQAGAVLEPELLSAGTLAATVSNTLVAAFNDLAGVERLVEEQGADIAAVIMEPVQHGVGCILPEPGFLEGLRSLTAASGIILIFDEVITGFRHGLGGFQVIAGVTPDLTVLGKGMGNGFPISAVAGRSDLMDHFNTAPSGTVFFAGTFNGHPACAAAAAATVGELARPGTYEHLFRLGERMRNGLREIAAGLPVPACVAGYGSVYVLYFTPEPPRTAGDLVHHDDELFVRYRQELIPHGVFETPMNLKRGHISASHTVQDIDATLDVASDVLKRLTARPRHR
jgi:glutamate-1-semialdehyde 2,1-aminomutase